MNNVSVADLKQFYLDTVILYKGKPAKVKKISAEKVFLILDLTTMKTFTDKEGAKFIDPPIRRLGMVNFMGSVLYVERVPYRKFQIGINSQNVKVSALPVEYPEGRAETVNQFRKFENIEIGECMFNIYPTIKECLENIEEFGGAAAFDKQFAINRERTIYYKTKAVGTLPPRCSSANKIKWNPGYEHLSILLENNHEKDLRNFATPCKEG